MKKEDMGFLGPDSNHQANTKPSANAGFSLVEVMAAAGILAAVVLTFAGYVHTFGMGMSNLNQLNDIDFTMARLSSAFGDSEDYCTAMIGPRPLSDSHLVEPITGPIIYYTRPSGGGALVQIKDANGPVAVIQPGQFISDKQQTKVKSIELKVVTTVPTPPSTYTTVVATLDVTFQKFNSIGASEVVRQIPIYAKTDGTKIKSCSTGYIASILLKDIYCSLSQLGYQHWDPYSNPPDNLSAVPPLGACVDNSDITWNVGSGAQVHCPAGMKVAIADIPMVPGGTASGVDPTLVCKSQTPASITPPKRIYSLGPDSTDSVSAVLITLDVPNSTCNFYFAVGSPTNSPNSIRCVPIPPVP
jgi:hypothetical protein